MVDLAPGLKDDGDDGVAPWAGAFGADGADAEVHLLDETKVLERLVSFFETLPSFRQNETSFSKSAVKV